MVFGLFIAVCAGDCRQISPDAPVSIELIRAGNGWEVYENGELVLEFTPENSDNSDLELLEYIHEVAVWHRSESQKGQRTGKYCSTITGENTINLCGLATNETPKH